MRLTPAITAAVTALALASCGGEDPPTPDSADHVLDAASQADVDFGLEALGEECSSEAPVGVGPNGLEDIQSLHDIADDDPHAIWTDDEGVFGTKGAHLTMIQVAELVGRRDCGPARKFGVLAKRLRRED